MNNLVSIVASFLLALSSSPQTQQAAVIAVDPLDLVSNVSNQIDSRLAQSNASNPSSALGMYTAWPMDLTTPWPRNPNSWTQKGVPLDFTGVGAFNDSGGYKKTGTLITPRHYVNANHFSMIDGTSVKFIDKNNNPVVRKVVKSTTIPGTDINIGELDSDVSTSIAHYPLVDGASLHSHIALPCVGSDTMPIAIFNQNAEAFIQSFQDESTTIIDHNTYKTGTRAPFSKELVGGDSSQPGFIVVNNQPILIFTNYQTNVAPNLGYYINDINNIISNFKDGTGYRVSTYDLSGFKTYTSCLEADPGPLSVASINPTSARAGALIAVTGTGFNLKNNTVHLKNGSTDKTIPNISAGTTYLQFNLPASTDIDPGTYMLSIQNSKGDISNQVSLTITAPVKGPQTTQDTNPAQNPVQNTPKQTYTLGVSKKGTGKGTVKTNYIFCGTTCTQPNLNSGDTVTLTATPDAGSSFSGWSGGSCSGTGSCVIRISSDTSIVATFDTVKDVTAPVISSIRSTPTSSGTTITWITNEPADTQVEYGPTQSYGASTVLNFSLATTHSAAFISLIPNTTYHYRVKSADEANNLAVSNDATFTTLQLPVNTNPNSTSTVLLKTSDLLITKTGSGEGSVVGGSISCGTACVQSNIPQDTSITLVATPDSDSKFVSWSGGGCSDDPTCTIKVSTSLSVDAVFSLIPTNQNNSEDTSGGYTNNNIDPYAQSPQFHYSIPTIEDAPAPQVQQNQNNDSLLNTPVDTTMYTQTYTPSPVQHVESRLERLIREIKGNIVLLPEDTKVETQKDTSVSAQVKQQIQTINANIDAVYQRILNGVEKVLGGSK